jgi:SAM-dependent methyltransferase
VEAGDRLTPPDVIDDGEHLEAFADGQLDFVIANHFIEHTQDPIGAVEAHLRVLRPGGVIYMAVPDKRATFDRERSVTSLQHLISDHADGPDATRPAHYKEWAAVVEHAPPGEVVERASDMAACGASIHFHVWTPCAFLEMLLHMQGAGAPFDIELSQQNGGEFLTVLRRRA